MFVLNQNQGFFMKKYLSNLASKMSLTLVFVGFSLNYAAAQAELLYTDVTKRKEFTTIDQRNAKFVSIGKPFMVKHKPALDEIDLVFCGWYDEKNNDVNPYKKSIDLENMVPTRFTAKFVDTNVKIDRVYQGFRESFTEQLIEGMLRALQLYPHLAYEGTLLVDEYIEAIPMKWVLNDINDFKALKNYLIKKFTENHVQISQEKPLLLIDFVKKEQAFDEEDIAFLNTYYATLNPNDNQAKAFFKDLKSAQNIAREDTKDAKSILESPGEMLIRIAEDKFGSLKTKDIIIKTIAFGSVCFIGAQLIALITDPLKDGIHEILKPSKKN